MYLGGGYGYGHHAPHHVGPAPHHAGITYQNNHLQKQLIVLLKE